MQLRKEVVKLHREMTNTSAQDDFAKWAKLRRQHDKKKAEYEKNGTPPLAKQPPHLSNIASKRLTLPPSPIPPVLPLELRPRRFRPALDRHLRRPLRAAILVLQAGSLLDPSGLGAVLRRMAFELPARAAGQCECEYVVDCLRECDQDGERGGCCALDAAEWRGEGG